jgi:hypothetical protein
MNIRGSANEGVSLRPGLAAVLILVSFLCQRFMTGKDEKVKVEGTTE